MIYVIPSPLVDNEEINLKKKTRGFVEITAPNFWYLHGALSCKFHYDKGYMFIDYETSKTEEVQTINNMLYLKPGIYNNIVIEGYDTLCKGYFWQRKFGDNIIDMCGVIVDSTDQNDVDYAEKLYSEKPFAY